MKYSSLFGVTWLRIQRYKGLSPSMLGLEMSLRQEERPRFLPSAAGGFMKLKGCSEHAGKVIEIHPTGYESRRGSKTPPNVWPQSHTSQVLDHSCDVKVQSPGLWMRVVGVGQGYISIRLQCRPAGFQSCTFPSQSLCYDDESIQVRLFSVCSSYSLKTCCWILLVAFPHSSCQPC